MKKKTSLNIGLLGMGTIGTGVAQLLCEQRDFFLTKLAMDLNLAKVADKDWSKGKHLCEREL